MRCLKIQLHKIETLDMRRPNCNQSKVFSFGILSSTCIYQQDGLDLVAISNTSFGTEECFWGCCSERSSPCCSVPINLIVGVILGGLIVLGLIVITVCYLCVCRRNRASMMRSSRDSDTFSLSGHEGRQLFTTSASQARVTYFPDTSGDIVIPAYGKFYDAPPSYDVVMKGQVNQAFKSETAGSLGASAADTRF